MLLLVRNLISISYWSHYNRGLFKKSGSFKKLENRTILVTLNAIPLGFGFVGHINRARLSDSIQKPINRVDM